MREEILSRQAAAMHEQGIDAIVSCSPENFAYAAGFVVPSQPLLRHRHAMAVVSADAALNLFVVDMEESTVVREAPGVPLTIWKEFSDDAMSELATMLRGLGLSGGRIGIEMDYLPAGDFARLSAALPGVTFVPAEHLLSRLRQIKTPGEVALLRRLARIADQAIGDTLSALKPGDTELDIAAYLTRNIYELGAEHFKLLITATGERSQLPNVGPTDRKLVRGDVCRVEIFSVIGGYQAGVCRTAYVEEPPPMAEEVWQVMVDCKYRLLDLAKPGADCLEIYNDFVGRLKAHNLPPISFVGHGIGLHLHEDPYLGATPLLGQPGKSAALEENMVLGFEPLCYRTGYGFGVQNKDLMLITATGSELLSDYTDTDRLIRIG
ncbi:MULTISPECIES: Xaa-Pro peptidase family protein [Xanthobacter]|uniref:M24 family metallopeptidase n=1 Tax=Xanthobacter TaxID=279 RepID=UPI001E2A803D|nr:MULTISPECIES: Xaa-Pro peptidase family protein [Xanthobacter]UDQ87855.1 Xaa-Pro peptidase family protein [Xanthobacter autotrophicus]UJX46286.1 aminopeptidase P family protein [Xanthobacter sp. YC-JY1]